MVNIPDGFELVEDSSIPQDSNIPQGFEEVKPQQAESPLRTGLEQTLQGATFNLSDELTNRLGAFGASLLTDDDYDALLGEATRMSQERLARQREQYPVGSTVAQMTGAIGTGVAGAGTKAGQALLGSIGRSGLAGKVGKSAIASGTAGGVAGFGAGKGGVEERLPDAQTGALVGASIGGALPVVGTVARQAIQKAQRAGTLVKGRDADVVISDVLANQDLKTIQTTLEDGKSISSLVDVAGNEARGLLRSVAKKTGGTKNMVTDFLENRSEEAGSRIHQILSKKVSNIDNYFQNLDDLAKGRAVASAPLYKKAEVKGTNLKKTQRLNTLLADKRIVDAIDEGKKTFGVSAEAKRNSVAAIDGAKKALDDDISALERAGRSGAAGRLRDLKKQLVGEADRQVPEYKKARAVFSGFKSVEDAQERGLKFIREDPELISRTIKELTPSEHDAYLIGVRRALKNQIDRTADAGDPAKKIFGNKLVRDRIKAAFPDMDDYKEFSKRMKEEIGAAHTKFKVLEGSGTDFNLAQDGALLINAAQAAAERGTTGVIDKITGAVFESVRQRALGITNKNAKKIANILIDKKQGVEAIERLLQQKNQSQVAIIEDVLPDLRVLKAQQITGLTGATTLPQQNNR